MKRILFIGGLALLCQVTSFAQNSNVAKLSSAPKHTAAAPILNSTTTTPLYPVIVATPEMDAKKQADAQAAINNQTEATKTKEQMIKTVGVEAYQAYLQSQKTSQQKISRATYNSLPVERKKHMDAHPEEYKIVD